MRHFISKGYTYACGNKQKFLLLSLFLLCSVVSFAQSSGTSAISSATTEIAQYIPLVQKLIYAIAAVVVVIGAVSVFIKMNNEEQDVKKSIMLIVGACIFLVAAATSLPSFFGY